MQRDWNEYTKEYRETNKDVLALLRKEYNEKNKEAKAKYMKEYKIKNKEVLKRKKAEKLAEYMNSKPPPILR